MSENDVFIDASSSPEPESEQSVVDESVIEVSEEDVNNDGIVDTIVTVLSDGSATLVTDVDGDTVADTMLFDLNGDGTADIQVVRSGDNYLVAVDDDGDGQFVESEQVVLTRDELAELNPDIVAALDTVLDEPVLTPDESGKIEVATEEDWDWFQQAENGHCVPASVAQIVEVYTGIDFPDESAFVELAEEKGLAAGDDIENGMYAEDAQKLLVLCGIPAELEYGDMQSLAETIDDGRGVMVFVDSGEYWSPTSEQGEDNAADHAVVVTAIDLERGVVFLSDPGHPDGEQMQVPLDQFEDAWADSDFQMVVCDQPVPTDVEEDATVLESRLGATNDAAPATSASEDGNVPTRVQAVAENPMESAVAWLTERPWVLLPVVLPVAAAASTPLFNRTKAGR
ncbi:C39 family peptidase [Rhodococcus indonesiensis]